MAPRISPERRACAVCVVGGPTVVLDIGGLRLVTDPTFDEAGEHGYLTKTAGPAVHEDELAPVDAVLVSHDLHPDNLDVRGRAFALASSLVLTGPASARRLGHPARGLAVWESVELPRPGGDTVTVHAVPAQHGPDDGERDEQNQVNCEVTGFVLSGTGLPTVYVSGDNASVGVVAEIARRMPPVDIAVLFMGGARVPVRSRNRPLTLTAERASAAASVLGSPLVVPAHCDSWAHFTEDRADIDRAFDDAGLSARLRSAENGVWIDLGSPGPSGADRFAPR
ncbi:MBL fold metallo-hydrolase [Streptomyces sp. NPDC046977]|uniref:MBL fold metallo-hydrolase n=1 Tax=Streptomyces sp. NPDC046977 TaxID=3154703 RepID=UPI0033BFFEB8